MLQVEGEMTGLSTPDPLLEPSRLAALRDLDLLASPPLDSLSRINDIASSLLGVPLSALSLVSWDRQITAGMNGLVGARSEVLDTPFSHSFCHHVVRSGEAFVVEDAREHPLVMDNLAIRDSNVIAYAGVPIRLSGGECVGALCATDSQPRRWTDRDLRTLEDLAVVAVDLLELQRLRRDGGMRDALTGLPRRALFTERLTAMLEGEAADRDPVTVVAVDLQAFRLFNEAWGHDAGDIILGEVARRFRDTTGDNELVCRLAGDEFLIAQSGPEAPDALVGRLRQMLTSPPIRVEGVDQPVSALFVATESKPGLDAVELVDDALATLAATKATVQEQSRGPLAGPAMQRLRLRNAIVGAERRNELTLHYQPLLDLQSGRVHSLEALLRWEHPELGPVSPVDFIPVAESTGAIVPIGEWVLRQACSDLARWRHEFPDDDVTVAVNVAPEQVRLPSFDAAVGAALEAAHLPAAALALEITERTILEDRVGERRTIDALQARGVDLHLDDFGTGYSSLGYLTKFPLDVLKIDRVFVSRLAFDDKATALVAGIIAMAHSLGLRTVAEGIEDETQRAALTAMGCDFGQGFLFARPAPGDSVPDLLRRFDRPGGGQTEA